MAEITWDQVGERFYETGVDHGVLYIPDAVGVYDNGVAWNGLTAVTESPSGAESNKQYADNIVYLNLISAEEFGATLEAFTYPKEFGQFDGSASPVAGVYVGQQTRKAFGLSYRTRLGNDVDGSDFGYKLHLVYGAQAAPSEKSYATINDSPEPITFSWELTTTPVAVGTVGGTEYKPTASITINSNEVDEADLTALEDILYGRTGSDPRLPLPAEVFSLFGAGSLTTVNMDLAANQPTFTNATGVVTLPAVTGVQWQVDGENVASGAQPAIAVGEEVMVEATAQTGYVLDGDTDWTYERV
jgi:hypothetical protein